MQLQKDSDRISEGYRHCDKYSHFLSFRQSNAIKHQFSGQLNKNRYPVPEACLSICRRKPNQFLHYCLHINT